ncbi:hypothetical protein [Marinobacter sp. W-8]|uniref:hypothetical protein n=1 Tax=Marinobacter sp. W-8 TaxID=3369658 RepID=UPI0037CB8E9A
MKDYDVEKSLISIHLPKCGGSSLTSVLKDWFGDFYREHYYRPGVMPEKLKLSPGLCIHGHFVPERKVSVKDYYPEASQFITFVRDPLKSVESLYYFNLKRSKIRKEKGLDNNYDRFMTKFPDVDHFVSNAKFWMLDQLPFEVNKENYKKVISEFVYIGVVEEYERSLAGLSDALGKKMPELVPHKNKGEIRKPTSHLVAQEFRERHQLEYMFYSEVLALLKNADKR